MYFKYTWFTYNIWTLCYTLGVEIDNKHNCEKHISTLCRKASKQLNAIGRVQHYIGKIKKEIIINFFVYSNFMYYPLTWHFCSKEYKKNEWKFSVLVPKITVKWLWQWLLTINTYWIKKCYNRGKETKYSYTWDI